MSKKITKEEFLSRFYRNYPDSKIEIVNYTAISNPAEIKCCKCGRAFKKDRARFFLTAFNCCGSHPEISKIKKLEQTYKENEEFDFIKQDGKDYLIVYHKKCGQQLKRTITGAFDNPFACKYCRTNSESQKLSIEEVQESIDSRFGGRIKILDYNGQLKKNHYKCLKCGLIFVQSQTCLMQSRGCPKCDRNKSLGERKMRFILEQNGLNFKEQVSVEELPLQHFDFAILENEKIKYFIEVQGEQHYEKREIFRDSLEKIQERDKRKRDYCALNNIPLYEIIYKKGVLKNLDILPFNSTTISAKESTL